MIFVGNQIVRAALFLALAGGLWAEDGRIGFNRDIRPILSDKCFHCHGPDKANRKAGLRLDTFDGATEEGAIVPGKAMASEIIARMESADPDEHMPPPESKLPPVTSEEVALVKRWIAEGAAYEKHWSFNALAFEHGKGSPKERAAELDGIVESGLRAQGLAMQGRAEADKLLRRLCFDLTGLPPTVSEVDDFAEEFAADAGAAVEKWVDRLLARPAYGERMAVDWLDVARYADSYGFQVDREREVWMWRDWVVRAFNENLPFDDFVTWQVAGDLMPGATEEQILATAFNRLHQQESEGGSVEEEYRVEYVADRVQTFATAFLGLTFECSRCHDHKFDPVTQEEYFGLFSLLQNIDEAGLYSFFTPSTPTPALTLLEESGKKVLKAVEGKLRKEEAKLAAMVQRASVTAKKGKADDQIVVASEVARYSMDALGEKNSLANALDAELEATLSGQNVLVDSPWGKAVKFTGDDAVTTKVGNFHAYEPFSVSMWIHTPDVKERAVVMHRSRAWTDAASRGYELLIEEGRLKWSLIHFWPGNAASVRAKKDLPVGEWVQVLVTSDGSARAEGLTIYANGKRLEVEVVKDALTRDITGGGGDTIALGERFRDRGFGGGMIDELRVFDRELTALEAVALWDGAAVGDAEECLWIDHRVATGVAEVSEQKAAVEALRAERMRLMTEAKEIMVMQELPEPKPAYVLFRGEYNQRREEVKAQVPAFLNPMPAGAPMNRLGLAQWLTDREHPLLARVTVNRLWQGFFGRGLVKTAEDFGSQGEQPRYPDLLDALAEGFIESGWDVKALMKTIALSRIYQQDSLGAPEQMKEDPENVLLARGPRFRLSAEMIRDNALVVAGLLVGELGGPPVKPYELVEAFKPFEVGRGGEVFRRSLYTTWRRTSPPPAMVTFDAPRRAICSVKRERTDSPLQALILLNGEQYVEAARVLGERLVRTHGKDSGAMIEEATKACLSRRPEKRERAILGALLDEQGRYFGERPEEARALVAVGQTPADQTLSVAEVAAATVMVQALMNHDESVVKR